LAKKKENSIFANRKMVDVAQLVRVADCGSVGRGFEPHLPPKIAPKAGAILFSYKIFA
jgi:hypothetical protein